MYYFDTETCGLHGPIVLIQYQRDEGPIVLHEVWHEPISATLALIESMASEGVIGFNLSFDWFHICQLYTTLSLFEDKSEYPVDNINEYAYKEILARDGACLKPAHAFDIMLHARTGPYQSLMDRSPIRIKKVPTLLAYRLADKLTQIIPLKDAYFSKNQDPSERWKVTDITDDLGDVVPDFKDLVLAFNPSSALKTLAADALNLPSTVKYADIECEIKPEEDGFAPFALAPIPTTYPNGEVKWKQPSRENWWRRWPAVIEHHIKHWRYNDQARVYAETDVYYTRALYDFFGRPPIDDDDSVLACMVGAQRWKGFKVDIAGVKDRWEKARATRRKLQCIGDFGSVDICKKYLFEVLSTTERMAMVINEKTTTKGVILEELAKWKIETVCDDCNGVGCPKCDDGTIKTDEPHPVAARAQLILDFRHLGKEIELYEKLLIAGRLHSSYIVIGALSSRMSGGGGGLNPQGIKRAKYVRALFPLAFEGETTDGGDFDGFEVTIADAVYHDEILHERLVQGKKIHALFGIKLFKPMTYDEIRATSGLAGDQDKYGRSKNGVFAMLYGGDANTLQERVGVSKECAEEAYASWLAEYKGWGKARQRIFEDFCSMRQPGGIGSKVEWHDPKDYISSLLGFRRYYTLENTICKALFQLAEDPPKDWLQLRIKVQRRDREQSITGAVRSALFAAAFAIQASNMRSAANHEIQSTGGQLTKRLQRRIWDLQPAGITYWHVRPFNNHDEIMSINTPSMSPQVETVVKDFITEYMKLIPLLKMEWKKGLPSWAAK